MTIYGGHSPRPDRIRDLQERIAAALKALGDLIERGELPRELGPLRDLAPGPDRMARVQLQYGETPLDSDSVEVHRKIRDDAGADHWSQDRGVASVRFDEVRIGYLPVESPVVAETPGAAPRQPSRSEESIPVSKLPEKGRFLIEVQTPEGVRWTGWGKGNRTAKREKAEVYKTRAGAERWIAKSEPTGVIIDITNEVQGSYASLPPELADLVRQLDHAERGRPYVVLTYFRDRILAESGLPWVADDTLRQRVLSEAIERGMVRTAKVPNPRNPAFPPTTVRLDREHADVCALLRRRRPSSGREPIDLPGRPLSQTIIEERR
jgi:hypothetical protein